MITKYEIIEYYDKSGKRIQAIELQEGYPGTVYSYGNVKLITVPNEDCAVLEFDYTIHEGYYPEDEFVLFKNVIGDILAEIMTNGVNPMEID